MDRKTSGEIRISAEKLCKDLFLYFYLGPGTKCSLTPKEIVHIFLEKDKYIFSDQLYKIHFLRYFFIEFGIMFRATNPGVKIGRNCKLIFSLPERNTIYWDELSEQGVYELLEIPGTRVVLDTVFDMFYDLYVTPNDITESIHIVAVPIEPQYSLYKFMMAEIKARYIDHIYLIKKHQQIREEIISKQIGVPPDVGRLIGSYEFRTNFKANFGSKKYRSRRGRRKSR